MKNTPWKARNKTTWKKNEVKRKRREDERIEEWRIERNVEVVKKEKTVT